MLVAPSLKGRTVSQKCVGSSIVLCRLYTKRNGREPYDTISWRRTDDRSVKVDGEQVVKRDVGEKETGPSLYEQLFPDQHEAEVKKQRQSEVPRLPIKIAAPEAKIPFNAKIRDSNTVKIEGRSRVAQELESQMLDEPRRISVLVLRNASKNLVEEDFKRIIPQGKHLQGWRLEKGDVIQIVPGRDLEAGEQMNHYYLLFSSPHSAFTYQGHATRIHRIVAAHTPASVLSAIPPPPGLMIDGMNAHSAMQSFSLIPPTQSMDLRQLKPPLPRGVEHIIRHNGYAAITTRKDRLPYEARLTFEGPQLHLSAVKHVLVASARDRGLAWSGGEDLAPKLSKWEPYQENDAPPASEMEQSSSPDHAEIHEGKAHPKFQADDRKRRTPLLVYIAGFHTERAMQSFVHYWHRRPMDAQSGKGNHIEAAELPPIANVEVLW